MSIIKKLRRNKMRKHVFKEAASDPHGGFEKLSVPAQIKIINETARELLRESKK